MSHEAVDHINSVIEQGRATAGRVVAFYSCDPHMAPWEWFVSLVPLLREKGFFVLAVATYALPESVQDLLPCFIIERAVPARLRGVDGFVCMDTDAGCFPQSSRVLAVAHGYIFSRSEWALESSVRNMLAFDGYLVNFPLSGSRTAITHHWQGLWAKELYRRTGTRFDILSCGYLRSAALYDRLKNMSVTPDALCYAPILRHHAPELGGDRMFLHARDILRMLLSAFPEYTIIFRPFSSDLEDPFIQKLAEDFSGEPRFLFDSAADKCMTFARSAAIVTDISHIANSFSFTTLRPTLAFRPWENLCGLEPQPFGGIVSTLEQLEQALRFFLTHRGKTVNLIRKGRACGALPIENAFEDFVGLLEAFLDDSPRTDLPDNWLSIARNGAESETSVAEMILRLLSVPASARFHLQQIAGSECLRREPLFWATLLLEWRKAEPESELILSAQNALKELLPDDMSLPKTYGESLPAALYLVRQSMRNLPDADRAHYGELCRRLLDMCTDAPGAAARQARSF